MATYKSTPRKICDVMHHGSRNVLDYNFKKYFRYINPLPYTRILDLSKSKAFAYDNFIVTQNKQFFFDRVENILGKDNAGFQQLLLFQQCFQKASFSGSIKVFILW